MLLNFEGAEDSREILSPRSAAALPQMVQEFEAILQKQREIAGGV